MYCEKCGTENTSGAKFCRGCGNPLNGGQQVKKPDGQIPKMKSPSAGASDAEPLSSESQNAGPSNGEQAQPEQQKAPQMPKINKSLPKKAIAGAAAAVVVIAAGVVFVTNSGKTIDLDHYLTVEMDGYDGYGSAKTVIDWDAMEEKYGSKLEFTQEAKKMYGNLLKLMDPMDVLKENISVDLDVYRDLSNGDTVSYTWDIDEDVEKYLNCKVKGKDGSTKVSGLEDIGTFDAFADLDVSFEGMDSDGWIQMNYKGSLLDEYDFVCADRGYLKNGDVVMVSLDNQSAEYYANRLGMVPEAFDKEYTVSGLAYYLSRISEISDEAWAQMKQQASDVYLAKAAQNWGEWEELQNLSYQGSYLLTAKDNNSKGNELFLVYKAQIRDTYSNDDSSYDQVNDIYWYIKYEDLVVEPDGTVSVNVTSYDTPNNRVDIDSGISTGWWSTKGWNYYGYDSLDSLYKSVVTANLDHYNHEDYLAVEDKNVSGVAQNTQEEVKEPTTEEAAIAAENDYILPDSDKVLLTDADLEGLSQGELRIARNEIYARHGRTFDDPQLQAYFDACDWYEGTISPSDFQDSSLSEIERANRALIVAYEEEKGYK